VIFPNIYTSSYIFMYVLFFLVRGPVPLTRFSKGFEMKKGIPFSFETMSPDSSPLQPDRESVGGHKHTSFLRIFVRTLRVYLQGIAIARIQAWAHGWRVFSGLPGHPFPFGLLGDLTQTGGCMHFQTWEDRASPGINHLVRFPGA
jgi:hypothetical protein